MNDGSNISAIAVDGGGTQCRIAAITCDSHKVVVAGAANAFSNFDGTVQTLNNGLSQLAEQLSVPVTELVDIPAYLGLAGVIDKTVMRSLEDALPLKTVKIEEDKHAALRGALGNRDGIIAHCGTGSFFAMQSGSTKRFVGGWGPVLDDIASSRWMGCRSLALTLRAEDGLSSKTDLTEYLLQSYGSAPGIVEFADNATSAEFGQLARVVSEHAKKNDKTAVKIFNEGAALIADTITALGWHSDPVCLTGGLGPEYIRFLPESVRSCVVEAKGEPLDGAIALAREFSKAVSV